MRVIPEPSRRGRRSAFFPVIQQRPRSNVWPASDQALWGRAIAPATGPFEDPGPAAHLAQASQNILERTYGNYVSWLTFRSLLNPASTPAERMQPAWVTEWLHDTCARVSAKTAAMMLINLSLAIEVMVPDQEWRWIRKLPGRPSRKAVRASANQKPKPEVPDTVAMAAGALAICEAMATGTPSIKSALRYRDALLVAFACYHAPRLRNLAEIKLGTHLVRGSDDIWRLQFEATKNGRPLTPRLGQGLVTYLERYLQIYRPLLLRGKCDHGFLWVNQRTLPLASTAFHHIFDLMGKQLVGYGVYPNIVRHGVATALLSRNPRSLTIAAAALGHRSTASVNTVYDKSGRTAAAAEWERVQQKWMR